MRPPEAQGLMSASNDRLRSRGIIAGAALSATTILLLLWHSSSRMPAGVQQKIPRLTWGRSGRTACRLEMLAYEPSEWEEEWREHAEEYQDRTCKVMLEQSDLVDAWMQPMNISFSPKVVAMAMPAMQSSRVFSHFQYLDSCSGREVRTPIEPLVGLLRHPTSECQRPDRLEYIDIAHDTPLDQRNFHTWCDAHPKVDCRKQQPARSIIENKGYMIIQPLPADVLAAAYPGRKYLFDLGTGRFSSGSLPWLLSIFAAKGIEFDEIWGWEITEQDPVKYWDEWPPSVSSRMHFRNRPCEVEPQNPRNPLNILRRMYRPGDYVAVKLDIDNEPIEQALLHQLDQSTINMIAECFTEIHFNNTDMIKHFGQNLTVQLPAVINQLQEYRQRGLRIHYWP